MGLNATPQIKLTDRSHCSLKPARFAGIDDISVIEGNYPPRELDDWRQLAP